MTEKTCRKCGQTKPATAEHFRKDSKAADGLGMCKACFLAWQREYRKRKKHGAPGAPEQGEQHTAFPLLFGAPEAPRAPSTLNTPGATGAPRAPEQPFRVPVPTGEGGRARYIGKDWIKRGVILRREYVDRLKEMAWRKRVDLTTALDDALKAYFERAKE